MAVLCVISSKHRKAELKREMELRQETHSGIADLEQYVYDTVGPDIYFKKPVIDDEKRIADLYLIQSEERYRSLLFDEARSAINSFLFENADYHLNDDYRINLYYQRRETVRQYKYIDNPIGYSKNYFDFGGYSVNGSERASDQIHVEYDGITVVVCFNTFQHINMYGSEDIDVLDISNESIDYNDLIDIANNIQSLKYLYISDWDREDDAYLIEGLRDVASDVIVLVEHRCAPTSAY